MILTLILHFIFCELVHLSIFWIKWIYVTKSGPICRTFSHVIIHACMSFKLTGFRHVRLRAPNNTHIDLPSMFIHTRLEEVQDMVSKVISENQRKRQMLSDMLHYHIGKEKDDNMEFNDVSNALIWESCFSKGEEKCWISKSFVALCHWMWHFEGWIKMKNC